MTRFLAVLSLVYLLAGCGGGGVTAPCPDPDPDPLSPCATSHGQTHGG